MLSLCRGCVAFEGAVPVRAMKQAASSLMSLYLPLEKPKTTYSKCASLIKQPVESLRGSRSPALHLLQLACQGMHGSSCPRLPPRAVAVGVPS